MVKFVWTSEHLAKKTSRNFSNSYTSVNQGALIAEVNQ